MVSPTWRRTLWLMVGVQAIMSLSFSVSGPFLPLYVVELGVHPTSAVDAWSGVITSINALTAALLSPFWGALADRHGRKAMVIRSSIAACIFNALMGASQNIWQLFFVRAAAGVFGGFAASSMALVGTQVPEDRLGYSLGWMATGQLVGTLFGPLLGGLLADHVHNYREVFYWTSAGTLIGAIGCAAFVHESIARPADSARPPAPIWQRMRELFRHPSIVPLFVVIVLAQVSARGAQPIIPLFVNSIMGNTPWLATAAGAAIAVTGIADVIASPWLGKRSDRIGYRRIVIISLAGTALFTFPQAIAKDIWIFLALRFGVGIFIGGILPAANAWIGRLFPADQRGQIYGIMASATFLGMFVGPLLAGFFAARFGIEATFMALGVLTAANFVYVWLGTPKAETAGA